MHARALHCHVELAHIPIRQAELVGAQVVRLQYDFEEVEVGVFGSVPPLVRMTTPS